MYPVCLCIFPYKGTAGRKYKRPGTCFRKDQYEAKFTPEDRKKHKGLEWEARCFQAMHACVSAPGICITTRAVHDNASDCDSDEFLSRFHVIACCFLVVL